MVSAVVTIKNLTVGLADNRDMLQAVPYKEFVQPFSDRAAAVQAFLKLVKPDIRVQCVPMFTTAGPAAEEKNTECLVLDQDEIDICNQVNERRLAQGWEVVDLLSVDLAWYPQGKPEDAPVYLYEDDLDGANAEKPIVKISSETHRASKAAEWVSPERLGRFK